MTKYVLMLLSVVILCFFVKLIFWLRIKQRRSGGLLNSFFRYYNAFAFHESPSKQSLHFKKISNPINFIFWLCIIGLVAIFILKFDVIFPNTDVVSPSLQD